MSDGKIDFFGEEYDFIEESTSFSTSPLDFVEVDETVISESNGEKSPYKILGRVSGCFAPIGSYSRNRRIYENDHWNYVLQNVDLQERLKSRRIFGELGHAQKKIDDVSNKAGDISHIVTKMEVREDKNGTPFLFGEFEILDTPAGRILEAMYKGGAGLYVSSRAAGKLKPMPGNPGMSIVEKTNYFLHAWDVVLEPGFVSAKPVFEQVQENKFESKNVYENDTTVKKEMQGPSLNETTSTEPVSEQPAQEAPKATNEDISFLSSQVEKLAKIVEKVVDNLYELPEEQQASEEEKVVESSVLSKESLADFVELMSQTNISEEAFCDVLDIILKENK